MCWHTKALFQIDYLRWYVLITDWPDWPKGEDPYKEQMFAVYGADKWHRTYDPHDIERTPGVGYNKMYFNHADRERTFYYVFISRIRRRPGNYRYRKKNCRC